MSVTPGLAQQALFDAWEEELEALSAYGYSDGAPSSDVPAIDFPSVLLRIRVELLLYPALGIWEDVSAYVLYRDKIRITIGRTGEQQSSGPAKCLLTFKNGDRRFSPRNPLGPYYGLLLHNTKLRVSVNPGLGFRTRFTGYISEWPPSWTSGDDRYVSIQANGVKRRISQGDEPLRSSLVRAHLALDPVAYWSLEDASGATEAASEVNGTPMEVLNGGPEFAFDGGLAGSAALPQFVNEATTWDQLLVGDAHGTSTTAWTYSFWWKATMADSPTGRAFRLTEWGLNPLESDYKWVFLIYHEEPTATYSVSVDFSGYVLVNTGPDPFDGSWHHAVITAAQEGADIRIGFYVDGVLLSNPLTTTPDYTLQAVRDINLMSLGPSGTVIVEETSVWMGHHAVFDRVLTATEVDSIYQAGLGYLGESPVDRFIRLMTEEGIPATVAELFVDTEGMGPQGTETLDSLVADLEATNEGSVDDDLDGNLKLTSRTFYINQAPALTLEYTEHQMLIGTQPTDDDLNLSNDYEVTRRLGGKYRAQKTTGPLNLNDPADVSGGVFRYKNAKELSLETTAQATQHALYRLNLGTIDEPRWPVIPFDLAHHPELIAQWLNCVIGSRLIINDLPADVGYGRADQIILGWEETLAQDDWQVSIVSRPGSVYQVGILASGANYSTDTPRLDCNGSTLAANLDETQSNVDVAITDECVWVHTYGDYPIVIGGEEMMVTAVSAASGSFPSRTQTLTVTRSLNGVVKTHDASRGWEVHVRNPIRMAMGATS
jgi:hypothetical protein